MQPWTGAWQSAAAALLSKAESLFSKKEELIQPLDCKNQEGLYWQTALPLKEGEGMSAFKLLGCVYGRVVGVPYRPSDLTTSWFKKLQLFASVFPPAAPCPSRPVWWVKMPRPSSWVRWVSWPPPVPCWPTSSRERSDRIVGRAPRPSHHPVPSLGAFHFTGEKKHQFSLKYKKTISGMKGNVDFLKVISGTKRKLIASPLVFIQAVLWISVVKIGISSQRGTEQRWDWPTVT